MRLVELLMMRVVLWVGLPVLLLSLAVGPQRLWEELVRGWRLLLGGLPRSRGGFGAGSRKFQDRVAADEKVLRRPRPPRRASC